MLILYITASNRN